MIRAVDLAREVARAAQPAHGLVVPPEPLEGRAEPALDARAQLVPGRRDREQARPRRRQPRQGLGVGAPRELGTAEVVERAEVRERGGLRPIQLGLEDRRDRGDARGIALLGRRERHAAERAQPGIVRAELGRELVARLVLALRAGLAVLGERAGEPEPREESKLTVAELDGGRDQALGVGEARGEAQVLLDPRVGLCRLVGIEAPPHGREARGDLGERVHPVDRLVGALGVRGREQPREHPELERAAIEAGEARGVGGGGHLATLAGAARPGPDVHDARRVLVEEVDHLGRRDLRVAALGREQASPDLGGRGERVPPPLQRGRRPAVAWRLATSRRREADDRDERDPTGRGDEPGARPGRRGQRAHDLVDVRRAARRIGGQAARELRLGRDTDPDGAQPRLERRGLGQQRVVRALAGQRLEAGEPVGVDVRRDRRRGAAEQLGGHVRRRAREHLDPRERAGARRWGGEQPGDPEVRDPRAPIRPDQHVLGLEVAMDDAARVRGGQPAPGLHEHVEDLRDRATGRGEVGPEIGAVDELHHQEWVVAVAPDLEHRDHVRVRELGHHARLDQPIVWPAGVAQVQGAMGVELRGWRERLEDLDRDPPIELRVPRAIHRPHAATASAGLDQEALDAITWPAGSHAPRYQGSRAPPRGLRARPAQLRSARRFRHSTNSWANRGSRWSEARSASVSIFSLCSYSCSIASFDLLDGAIDLIDGGVGARGRVVDVRILRRVGLAALRELDRERVVAERVRVDARVVPRHDERGAGLARRRAGARAARARGAGSPAPAGARPRSSRCRGRARAPTSAGSRTSSASRCAGRVARDRADQLGDLLGIGRAQGRRRRAARARSRARSAACSAVSPTTSRRTSRRRRRAGERDRLGEAVLADQHDRRGSRSRRSWHRTTARGAAAAPRSRRSAGSSGSCSSATSINMPASSRRLHALCATAHASAASSPWRRNRSANGLPARMNGSLPSSVTARDLTASSTASNRAHASGRMSWIRADDPQQEVDLVGRGRGHGEPLDPHQRRAMPAIVHDVGALERLELVGALVLIDREPQREERVDHRLLAGQRRAGELERDAEALPVVVVDDLGIALDRERHAVLHRRRAVAPVALERGRDVGLELVDVVLERRPRLRHRRRGRGRLRAHRARRTAPRPSRRRARRRPPARRPGPGPSSAVSSPGSLAAISSQARRRSRSRP